MLVDSKDSPSWHERARRRARHISSCSFVMRCLRALLVPRRFAAFAFIASIYLFLVNSLGLSSLDMLLARKPRGALPHDETDADAHGEPRLEALPHDGGGSETPDDDNIHENRRQGDSAGDGDGGSEEAVPDDPAGPTDAHCARFRALGAIRPTNTLGAQRSARVLLLTSAWSLPQPQRPPSYADPRSTSRAPTPSTALGDYEMLLRALEANLANPWVLAVHVFVPPTACADALAAGDTAADRDAAESTAASVAAVRAEAAKWRAKRRQGGGAGGKSKGGGGGGGAPNRRSSGSEPQRSNTPAGAPPSGRRLLAVVDNSNVSAMRPPLASPAPTVSSRVRLLVGRRGDTRPPSYDALLRYAMSLQAAAPLIVIARADVVWPQGFNCLSSRNMLRRGAVLTLSCQVHTPTCEQLVPNVHAPRGATRRQPPSTSSTSSSRSPPLAPPPPTTSTDILANAAAVGNWSAAYTACRARPHAGLQPAFACMPLLNQCHKYSGVQHALVLANPPPAAALSTVGAALTQAGKVHTLSGLHFEYGSETRAADVLWATLPTGSVSNPCVDISPVCMRCAEFSEVQAMARFRSTEHLQPTPLARTLTVGGQAEHCVDVVGAAALEHLPGANATAPGRSKVTTIMKVKGAGDKIRGGSDKKRGGDKKKGGGEKKNDGGKSKGGGKPKPQGGSNKKKGSSRLVSNMSTEHDDVVAAASLQ